MVTTDDYLNRQEELDYGALIAQFVYLYPSEFRNGDIPWFHFWMLLRPRSIEARLSMERTNLTRAIQLGSALAWGNEGAERAARQDIKLSKPVST